MAGSTRKDWTTGIHLFKPADPGDSRSPCPALNALANHDILPRDGRNLTFTQVLKAIREVYDLSSALSFALTLGGFLLCGHRFRTRLDLHSLARHNRIEHDASLVHDNAEPGSVWAPVKVNPDLVNSLVSAGADKQGDKGLTIDDLVEYRYARNVASCPPKFAGFHSLMVRGECAFAVETLGDAEGVIDRDDLRTWFGEERLPDGWVGNVCGTRTTAKKLHALGDDLHKRVQKLADNNPTVGTDNVKQEKRMSVVI